MSQSIVDKILEHRRLDPKADTLDIASRVSIAIGQEVSEATVTSVLAQERERAIREWASNDAPLHERIRAQQQQTADRGRAYNRALRVAAGRSEDGRR